MRQPVGARVERRVAERAVLAHHRRRIRRARRLRREQLRQASPRQPAARVAFQPLQERVALRGRRIVQRAERPRPAPPTAASSSRTSRAASASTLPRSNRSVAYSSTPAMPAGAPSAPRRLAQASDRSNFDARGRRPARTAPQAPAAPAASRRVVLERQHHLEQRMPRQRARRVEHLDQPLERHVLVAVGRKVAAAHPRHQLARSSGCPTCRCAAPAC